MALHFVESPLVVLRNSNFCSVKWLCILWRVLSWYRGTQIFAESNGSAFSGESSRGIEELKFLQSQMALHFVESPLVV